MPKVCPVCDTVYADTNAFCPVDGTTLHVVDLEGGLIGSVIADRYLVTDLLGEGGMGKVYRARHVRLPQQAAIKVLRRDMVSDPAAVARFNREASNASRIDDENVARVYDFGEASGGTVYLAMEYVPGRTLKEVVKSEGPLAPRRAAGLVRQVARGLDAAHRLKIIHRDLKPDNVLVVQGPDGQERVKVVDFGIAKAFGAGDGSLTKTGFVVGTPEFMSPEQLLGTALDARSDVYALALVAFQCLTASLPFAGDTPERSMTARLSSPPRRLLEAAPNTRWPESLQAVFDAALSREVDLRPESAGTFAQMLASAIDEWERGVTTAAAASPPAATPRRKDAGTVTEQEAVAPAPSSGQLRRWSIAGGLVAVAAVAAVLAYGALQNDGAPGVAETPPDSIVAQAPPPTAVEGGEKRSDAAARTPDPRKPESPAAPGVAPASDSMARTRTGADAAAKAPVARESTVAPAIDPALRVELDSLSNELQRRPGMDAASARRVAAALRALVPRLTDGAMKTRAYLRLIDASALSGDITGACAALQGAQGSARTESLQTEVRRKGEQLGCG
ncbi:MAG: serine/threonine-protein kinase [Gemmatimonadaceae bacterium]